MAETLLTHFKRQIAGLELVPSAGGCFELSIDDELVYSKLATGEFPDEGKLVSQIEKMRA